VCWPPDNCAGAVAVAIESEPAAMPYRHAAAVTAGNALQQQDIFDVFPVPKHRQQIIVLKDEADFPKPQFASCARVCCASA